MSLDRLAPKDVLRFEDLFAASAGYLSVREACASLGLPVDVAAYATINRLLREGRVTFRMGPCPIAGKTVRTYAWVREKK